MGGVNQAGVVVELMWLDDTRYPVRDVRRSPCSNGSNTSWIPPVPLRTSWQANARTHMVPLTAAANHALVRGSTKKTSFPRQTPDAEIAAGARYGFSAACPGGTR